MSLAMVLRKFACRCSTRFSRNEAITRGGRKWEFEYDNNGNLVLETAPYPSGGIKMNYQSSYAFDVLDRPTTVVAAVRDLNASGAFRVEHPCAIRV